MLTFLLLSAGPLFSLAAQDADHGALPANSLGKRVNDFALQDYRGKAYRLADLKGKPVVVAYFMGTDCPLAKLYGPKMQQIERKFREQGVVVFGINSNVQDSITEIAAYARRHSIEFPILKDVGNKVADQFGAARTPEVFVLDRDRVIRYQGRVDGQYTFGSGIGQVAPREGRADLEIAIRETLAGLPVSVARTETRGCLIGRARQPGPESRVTYSNQVARILQNRCVECHREGQIAPFALDDYLEAAGWGEMIAEVVREQRMPPWHADPRYGQFANALQLSEDEKEQLYTWVEAGCPEGDPRDLPEPREFHEGWFLPDGPDEIFFISEEPVPVMATGTEPYRYYEVDPGFTTDKFVRVAECMPGTKSVVHHIIVYLKPPGTERIAPGTPDSEVDTDGFVFLVGFAPGTRPLAPPEGWGKRIPAGYTLVFEMHYTPIGSPQTDQSSVGLVYMDEDEVTHLLRTGLAWNRDFTIPAHAGDHRVDATHTFKFDTTLLALFPHMHVRGKSFRYELTYPDGTREVLLDVPRYDFNWQNYYILAEPKVIPKGSRLDCEAHFDNSQYNLANPNPDIDIQWGLQTYEEMMIGFFDAGVPKEVVEGIPAPTFPADDDEATSGD